MTDRTIADGDCLIEVILLEGTSALSSQHDVGHGAAIAILECIDRLNPSEGGVAKEFGGFLLFLQVRLESQ